jgi:hypothetical protein
MMRPEGQRPEEQMTAESLEGCSCVINQLKRLNKFSRRGPREVTLFGPHSVVLRRGFLHKNLMSF